MISEQMLEVKEREIDLQIEFLQKEEMYRNKIEIAEVFGRMCERVQIATNLIGVLNEETIAEVTGVSLSHIKCISGSN